MDNFINGVKDMFSWISGNVGASAATSNFTSFPDLMRTMRDFNGEISDPTKTKAALWFYNYWGSYLQPTPGFMTFLALLGGWGIIGLYNITAALENVFNNLFKLFGLFGYLEDPNTIIGTFYKWFQILGVSIFILLAVVQIIISVFGKPFKYKDAILHLIVVTAVVAVLPMALNKISQAIYSDINGGIEKVGSKNKDSLALQPIKDNVVDLMTLVNGKFNVKDFPMDKYGNLKPARDKNGKVKAYNNITDNPDEKGSANFVSHINFGAALGATDTKTLDKLEKKQDSDGNFSWKGIKGLFLHYPSDTDTDIQAVNEHRFISGANLSEKVYMRYKTNFLAIYAQFLVLITLFVLMSIKLTMSIFELLMTGLIAPIQGYSSVTSHKKFKELLMTMLGTFAGIYFEVIIMRIVLGVMRDFPTLVMTTSNGHSTSFFEGLGTFEAAVTSIIVYLGVFFGAMKGVSIVERWLGVSVGQSNIAQQVMGAIMVGNAAASAGKGIGQLAVGTAGTAISGIKATPRVAGNIANGASKFGGLVSGVSDNIAKQGLAATAKGGLMNAVDKVSDKAKNTNDRLQNKHLTGKTKGIGATQNNNPSAEDIMKHPSAYGESRDISQNRHEELRKRNESSNVSQNDEIPPIDKPPVDPPTDNPPIDNPPTDPQTNQNPDIQNGLSGGKNPNDFNTSSNQEKSGNTSQTSGGLNSVSNSNPVSHRDSNNTTNQSGQSQLTKANANYQYFKNMANQGNQQMFSNNNNDFLNRSDSEDDE